VKAMIYEKATRDAYGTALLELGGKNPDVVVLDSDLARSTKTEWFKNQYPDRFFNIGIAEANMVGIAAGMSIMGKIPYVTTYAIFIGRAYDQIRQAVSYARTNVKIVATHAGLSPGYDGGSHQGLEDLALMRVLPDMTILSPVDYNEAKNAVIAASDVEGPIYIRLGKEKTPCFTEPQKTFQIGKAYSLMRGQHVAVFATGVITYEAVKAARYLREQNIHVEVVSVPTIKPLDEEYIVRIANQCGCVVTVEEHNHIGGLYGAISECLSHHCPLPMVAVGMKDQYGETGAWRELLEKYSLTEKGITEAVHLAMQYKQAR